MRLVFMGTPGLSVPYLEALAGAGHVVSLVVTRPDQPAGRGGALKPPPVKDAAAALGLPVFQPARLKSEDTAARLLETEADAFVIVAYRILPPRLLSIPRLGCLNVHASLLPRYRGAAPIAWALINGDTETGVTTMLIDEGVDTGGVLLQEACPIDPRDDAQSLTPRLIEIGVRLMLASLDGMETGALRPVPQDASKSTPAPKLEKENGRIDWGKPAREIHNLRRGLCPWPGAYTLLKGRILKVLGTGLPEAGGPEGDWAPGQVMAADRDGLRVRCGAGTDILLTEVQPEGKRRMPGQSLVMGRYLAPGDRFGP